MGTDVRLHKYLAFESRVAIRIAGPSGTDARLDRLNSEDPVFEFGQLLSNSGNMRGGRYTACDPSLRLSIPWTRVIGRLVRIVAVEIATPRVSLTGRRCCPARNDYHSVAVILARVCRNRCGVWNHRHHGHRNRDDCHCHQSIDHFAPTVTYDTAHDRWAV